MFNFKNVLNPQKVTANANGFQSECNFVNKPRLELPKTIMAKFQSNSDQIFSKKIN